MTLEMVAIPEDRFWMGSPDSEEGRFANEGPQHEVHIQPFFIGRYQVTQAQYEAIMGTNPSKFRGADLPIEQVIWDDSEAFCKKLRDKTGKQFRLPSEAEWEYACRAGTATTFYFGNDVATLGEYAWFSKNSDGKTHSVGQKKANAFGLHDMHGNINEWCQDSWHDNYKGAPTNGSPWLAENENDIYDMCIVRGGCLTLDSRYCRSAFRGWDLLGYQDFDIGFRVALSSEK